MYGAALILYPVQTFTKVVRTNLYKGCMIATQIVLAENTLTDSKNYWRIKLLRIGNELPTATKFLPTNYTIRLVGNFRYAEPIVLY